MFRSISLLLALFAADVVTAAPVAKLSLAPIAIGGDDPKPKDAKNTHTQASSRIATPENVEWFGKLIDLNPNSVIITSGPAICVTNPEGQPLVLPRGPKPSDVVLSTPQS